VWGGTAVPARFLPHMRGAAMGPHSTHQFMSRRRVVVTGLGCISPVGNTVADAWTNLLAGQSGIDLITKFDASNFACKIAGEVKGLDLESYISAKDARAMDTFIHYGIAAAAQAVQDAGLPTGEALSEEFATRIACVIGSGIGGLPLIEDTHAELVSRGPRRITPFLSLRPSSTWWQGMCPCVLASRAPILPW